jgi:predicted dehydrogenase
MSGKTRAIVVGTGFGCRAQVPALRAAGFEVVGLVGTNAARTSERAKVNGIPESFTDLGKAIAATGAEAVTVSAPPHAHAELSITALEADCHVLCEKPFASDLAEAKEMLAAAEKAGKVNMLGHEIRFEPQRATVARALAEGIVGEPRLATVIMLLPQLTTQRGEMPEWWFDKGEGGGWLGALGSHFIDQLRIWLGEFASVSASLSSTFATRGEAEDTFTVNFRMESGVEGLMQSSAGTWGPPVDIARISGSEGTIWTEGYTVRFAGRDGEREIPIAPELALPPQPPLPPDPRFQTARWQGLVQVELPSYVALCEAFKAAIDGRPAARPVVPATFADGVAAMRVMDAIRASARNGGAMVRI